MKSSLAASVVKYSLWHVRNRWDDASHPSLEHRTSIHIASIGETRYPESIHWNTDGYLYHASESRSIDIQDPRRIGLRRSHGPET